MIVEPLRIVIDFSGSPSILKFDRSVNVISSVVGVNFIMIIASSSCILTSIFCQFEPPLPQK